MKLSKFMKFNCDKCGICCRHIEEIAELSHFLGADGVCINLDRTTNLCKIYDKRPQICRVDEMYQAKYFMYFENLQDFFDANEKACEILKKTYKD